jgi:hypothetical protein
VTAAPTPVPVRGLPELAREGSNRIRPIFEVLRAASAIELEVGEVLAEMEHQRLAPMTQVATW